MNFSKIHHRDSKVPRYLALWVVVVSVFAAMGGAARAEMIDQPNAILSGLQDTSSSANPLSQDSLWLDSFWSRADNNDLLNIGAGSAPENSDDLSNSLLTNDHSGEPVPSDLMFVGFAPNGASGGMGTGSNSTSGSDGGSSVSGTVLWISELPPPTLVGYIDTVENLDIPPAPPFELLRPPKVLTILA